jgi:hypothetical protein
MVNDSEMRLQLQRVVAYRDLCRLVRRSGRENVVFALVFLIFGYFVLLPAGQNLFLILVGVLISCEILAGLFKWFFPSAEGFVFDSIVLLMFAFYNLGMNFLMFQAGQPISRFGVLFGFFMLSGAINRFKYYLRIRKLFAERPTADHIAWFDELIHEIRTADPHTDQLVLDLPTSPHWKAKLLGTTAFFIALRQDDVLIVGPNEFELLREKKDRGTDTRRALLRINDRNFPEFDIENVTWENYQKWRAAIPLVNDIPVEEAANITRDHHAND